MSELSIFKTAASGKSRPLLPCSGAKDRTSGWLLFLLLLHAVLAPLLLGGCSHLGAGYRAKSAFEEADRYFNQGSYQSSLERYREILEKYPKSGDRALFGMGIVSSHPHNERRDYQRAQSYFQKLVKDYPASGYRQDSEMMIFYIGTVIEKDTVIAAQRAQIDTLRQEAETREKESAALRKKVEELSRQLTLSAVPTGPADRILVEKKARRMTLFSKGEVLKTYKIALGGDPVGPKERQGDNKTPEGTYFIDSRKKHSQYHISLHVSYPNEKDKKRARELGVSPGGDIMIHGIKAGFSWVGELHTEIDWTKGCIAVTDEEIEEIDHLVPDGTVVEIKP